MSGELEFLLSGEREYQHPKLRFWVKERAHHPEHVYRLEILRPRQGLVYGHIRLYMHVFDTSGQELQSPDEMAWDEELDEAFIAHGFCALSPSNESLRFSLALRRSLSGVVGRLGQGLFNAILLKWVRKSPFALRLGELLDEIRELEVGEDTRYFQDGFQQIHAIMARRAEDLTEKLGYDEARAFLILLGALEGYLDERFTVSERRALGLSR
jgi:hypothetical protein